MNRKYMKIVLISILGIVVLPIVAVFVYIFAFFHSGVFFAGDGVYRYPGKDGATFQVEFPPVQLTGASAQSYRFTRLAPGIRWVVGFRPDGLLRPRPDALVRLTLINERGQRVFDESVELRNAGGELVCRNGISREVPIDHAGTVRSELEGVGPDEGWGTHFVPRWLAHYSLEAKVLRPAPPGSTPIRLVMEAYTAGP